MKPEEQLNMKIDIALALNFIVLLLLLLPNLFSGYVMPGEADKMIQACQNDLDNIIYSYNAMAHNYNAAHPENHVPYYNYTEDLYGVQTDFLSTHYNLPELTALKNEGTARFDTYFAAAYNSNDWGRIMLAYDRVVDAGIREKALQNALENNDKELTKFMIGLMFILFFSIALVKFSVRLRQKQQVIT